ncbi:MAG TPA: sigma-70 family RNA polymerase sigma factor [Solirubrobacteraceae bacterium]|jgi:RNA polymerase sigma-70 factor (ECF subfamily)|nr:sigma-70 family RNA polymerase sigma factor [Solirubrobacteraceae bacterium]
MSSIDQQVTLSSPLRRASLKSTGRATADVADAILIARSLREPQEFAGVFDRHWPSIHAYCTSRAGAAGEDIAAEVFRLAFDRRGRYDSRLGDASSWLYGIATNLLRHHFRSAQRGDRAGRRALALAERETSEQPLDRLEAQLLGARLAAALEALPPLDREALLLLAWAELDYREIARALDVPVGTVRSRVHRARARVRTHITQRGAKDA